MQISLHFDLSRVGRKSADIMNKVVNVIADRVDLQKSPMFMKIEIMVTDDTLVAEYFDRDHQLSTHRFPVTLLFGAKPRKSGNIIPVSEIDLGDLLNQALDGKMLSG